MSKSILMESTKSKFKVLDHKPANVLKRIKGVLSDFKSNRNGRIYPRELWENVLNSSYVKEMIESHGLVGELDHPEERLEISLQNVSHVINDMWIEGDQVLGIIDILPTPSGKIVSELLDYGTDIGISSRGAGSVGAGNIVDPDYQFVTFDFVARPSCEAARLNMIVEGVQVEIDNNSDDKVNAILEGYKTDLKEVSQEKIDDTLSYYDFYKDIVDKLYIKNYGYIHYSPREVDSQEIEGLRDYILSNGGTYSSEDNKYYIDDVIFEIDPKTGISAEINTDMEYKVVPMREAKQVDFDYIGKDDWGRHIIKSKDSGTYFGDNNLTKPGKDRDLSNASWYSYSGNDPYDGEPLAPIDKDIVVNIVNKDSIPTEHQSDVYSLLYRLKSDCDYFLGYGDGYEGHLWAGSVDKQIAKMRELYDQLEEKPEWLTSEDIDKYEEEMKNYKAGSKNKRYQVIVTTQTAPGKYDTRVQGIYNSAEQAEDVCGELRAQGLGATYQELDESVKLNEGLKTIYNIDVDWLNDLRKEYESGDLSESDLKDIIEGYVTGTLKIRYEKNPDAYIGATTFAFKNITKDFSVNESTDYENKEAKSDISIAIDILSKLSLSQSSKINKQLISIVNRLRDIEYEINKDNLTEAVMSDQEVYKTVLNWYKQQIEAGNMTLNQCYELLSDKAKVSLNKMVDQSKIKESIMSNKIESLLKESIDLNNKE